MAKNKSVVVSIEGNAKGLQATIERSKQDIRGLAADADKSLSNVGNSFLDNLALKAKAMRRERRTSGEAALESALRDPTAFALDAVGWGVKGFIADQIGRGAGKATGAMFGEAKLDAFNSSISEMPLIGGFNQAITNIAGYVTGTTKAMREANLELEQQARIISHIHDLRKADLEIALMQTRNAGARTQLMIRDKLSDTAEKISTQFPTANEDALKKYLGMSDMGIWWLKAKDYYAGGNAYEGALGEVQQMQATDRNNLNLQNKRAREAFEIAQRQARQQTARENAVSTLSSAGTLLGDYDTLAGGQSWQSLRLQKQFGLASQKMAALQARANVLDNPYSSAADKSIAEQMFAAQMSYLRLAGTDEMLNRRPYTPLRFASGEDAGSTIGAATMAANKDQEAYQAKQAEYAKRAAEGIESLVKLLGQVDSQALYSTK